MPGRIDERLVNFSCWYQQLDAVPRVAGGCALRILISDSRITALPAVEAGLSLTADQPDDQDGGCRCYCQCTG
jgi:hypothetical protein